MAKRPGKTKYAGRRRETTRRSGFKASGHATGGQFSRRPVEVAMIPPGESLCVTFSIPEPPDDSFVAFGGFFRAPEDGIRVSIRNPNSKKNQLSVHPYPNWSKFGSAWRHVEGLSEVEILFESQSTEVAALELYGLGCGIIGHDYLEQARPALLKNLHNIAPEICFYEVPGEIEYEGAEPFEANGEGIPTKTCNRCARFLPINTQNERATLCFSNHCIARAPCVHSTFGKLRSEDEAGAPVVQLHYGFQLECRFCKKFAVNGALNPQRSAAQMKEDSQRRRYFELLLMELQGESPQLSYRQRFGSELSDDIWEKFAGRCFKCKKKLPSKKGMHLDHTRPLALLWPLDETATALCAECNSAKRDRAPSEFYSAPEIEELSNITGLSVAELNNPGPNEEAINKIMDREEWLMKEFTAKPEIMAERDGKITAELIMKALDKVLSRSELDRDYSFLKAFKRYQSG